MAHLPSTSKTQTPKVEDPAHEESSTLQVKSKQAPESHRRLKAPVIRPPRHKDRRAATYGGISSSSAPPPLHPPRRDKGRLGYGLPHHERMVKSDQGDMKRPASARCTQMKPSSAAESMPSKEYRKDEFQSEEMPTFKSNESEDRDFSEDQNHTLRRKTPQIEIQRISTASSSNDHSTLNSSTEEEDSLRQQVSMSASMPIKQMEANDDIKVQLSASDDILQTGSRRKCIKLRSRAISLPPVSSNPLLRFVSTKELCPKCLCVGYHYPGCAGESIAEKNLRRLRLVRYII